MISPNKLDFWIKNNYNVLFAGRHGVGKTSLIVEAFNRANLKWKYFSAATMDPWVDFIGVPKEKITDGKSYLELVRPQEFAEDEVEALFFDEFSRGHRKVKNACMELIQFKSINGKKFNNLKIIWVAINPDDDPDNKYDVDPVDPAQLDRFQVHIEIPYKPYLPYFVSVYGKDIADAAVNWWKDLPDKVKNMVSPRRLDYALDMHKKNGDMRDVLPLEADVSKLITEIQVGSISKKIRKLYEKHDINEAKQFLAFENSYSASINEILEQDKYIEFFFPLLEKEKISSLISKSAKARDFILANANQFSQILLDVVAANQNKSLVRKICKKMNVSATPLPSKELYNCIVNAKCKIYHPKNNGNIFQYQEFINKVSDQDFLNTIRREAVYGSLKKLMPSELDKKNTVKTLEVLATILSRTYATTLNRAPFDDILHLINFCMQNLYKLGETDIRDIQKNYINIGKAIDFGLTHNSKFYFGFEEINPLKLPSKDEIDPIVEHMVQSIDTSKVFHDEVPF